VTAVRAGLLSFCFGLVLLACGPKKPPARENSPMSAAPGSFEILGRSGPVAMGRLRLGPSQALRVPASACQEVLLFVEEGALRHEAHGWLRHGDAARFHGPTVVEAAPGGQTSVFAAIVRHPAVMKAESPSWQPLPEEPPCPSPSSQSVLADPARSGPFVHAEGKLRVHVYLDAGQDPDALATLGTLDADPTQAVPEHVHPASAEVLWIVDGAGTMRLGDDSLRIRPGTFVFVPAGTRHDFVPDATRPLFAYQLYAPPGPEQRFKN